MKKLSTLLLAGLVLMSFLPLRAQTFYTAYNVWYEKPTAVYCINYQRGTMIPAGTEINNVEIAGKRLSFTIAKTGEKIVISFNSKYHGSEVTIQTFKDRLVTTKTFDQLTQGLKPFEIEAIRQGIAVKGMSKKAVLISFGYPPEHKTPSLDDNQWTYWRNRFVMFTVPFEDGSVSQDIQ